MAASMPMLEQAIRLHQDGRFFEAEAAYDQALAQDPHNHQGMHLKGVLKANQGDWAGSVQWIRQAIAEDPANSLYHLSLGNAYRAQGQAPDALAAYEKASSLAPDNLDIRLAVASLQAEAGQAQKALEEYERILNRRPEHAHALLGLAGLLHGHRQVADAISFYEMALTHLREEDGVSPDSVWMALAEAYLENGQESDALNAFYRTVTLNPLHVPAYERLGALAAKHRLTDVAVQCYTTLQQLDPQKAAAYGTILCELKQPT